MNTNLSCAEARELMLDADPLELDPHRSSVLGQHLRTCNACAGDAARIQTQQKLLAHALDSLTAGQPSRNPQKRWRRTALRVAAPLAAAAMVLIVLEARPDPLQPILLPIETVPDAPVVN